MYIYIYACYRLLRTIVTALKQKSSEKFSASTKQSERMANPKKKLAVKYVVDVYKYQRAKEKKNTTDN